MLRARIRGSIRFACPNCGYLNSKRQSHLFRTGRILCYACHKRWSVGIWLSPTPFTAKPPLTARFLPLPPNGAPHNALADPGGSHAIAHPAGAVHFNCPSCGAFSSVLVRRPDRPLPCPDCSASFYAAILLSPADRRRYTTPPDWIIDATGTEEAPPDFPLSPAPPQSPGAHSEGP